MPTLAGRTMLISGGSRGIGLAIATRAAKDGANIVLLAKTDTPDPRLPGTVHSAAEQIEAAGGKALAVLGDVRREDDVVHAVERAISTSAASTSSSTTPPPSPARPSGSYLRRSTTSCSTSTSAGTFLMTSTALPYLYLSDNPHVLTLSPPINLDPHWLGAHAPYTLSKYGTTILTLGLAAQSHARPLAANCLWPRTLIATAAVQNLIGGDAAMAVSRKPQIMADAAHAILCRDAAEVTGKCLIDDDVLRTMGVTDFSVYQHGEMDEAQLKIDLFLPGGENV
jgi:citronellol/citronellal dehydrogenase